MYHVSSDDVADGLRVQVRVCVAADVDALAAHQQAGLAAEGTAGEAGGGREGEGGKGQGEEVTEHAAEGADGVRGGEEMGCVRAVRRTSRSDAP